MQKATRDKTYNVHSPHNKPQITVKPGEEFMAETEMCSGSWLTGSNVCWSPDKTCATNPTVVVAVEGAKPGDLLAVDILDVVPDAVGYTGWSPNPVENRVKTGDWGINTKTVEIKDGFVHWSDSIKLPVKPMLGTLGTAPAEEVLCDTKAGAHGGNMDVQEVCPGATVYLPVAVEGALLHIGDAHAIQGDGEIGCSGGIECRSVSRLRARLIKRPESYGCVRIENDEYIMTVGSEKTLEDSFYFALSQLLAWMEEDYSIPAKEGFLLLGSVMEARSTQFVNPTWSYVCKMPKKFLNSR